MKKMQIFLIPTKNLLAKISVSAYHVVMTTSRYWITIFLAGFLQNLSAQEQAPEPAAQAPVKSDETVRSPNQIAFTNLPEEKRETFFKHRREAYRLFNDKRIVEAHEEILSAMKVFNDDPETLNLLGSCYVEFRDFPKAKLYYDQAIKLAPDVTSILFNILEMEFVTRNWQKCLDQAKYLLTKLPAEEVATRRLAEFKMLLCYQALGNDAEAEKLANLYDPLKEDTPFYYIAQAALCYKKKDTVAAEEWNTRAMRVFNNPGIIAPWQDTLIEYGYIKSFYGGEQTETK